MRKRLSLLGAFLFLFFASKNKIYAHQFPPPGKEPLPIIYAFNDYTNQDWKTLHPEYGPIGVNWYWLWADIEPSDNNYNWGPIDRYIQIANSHLIQLDDGRILTKPVSIMISPLYQIGSQGPHQGMPTFVVQGCQQENPSWTVENNLWNCTYGKSKWEEFLREFGRRYDNNHAVNEIWLWLGFDSEEGNAGWHSDKTQPGYKATDGGPTYYQWCERQRDIFHEVFPNTIQFSQALLHQIGGVAQYLATKYPGGKSGVKNNGWVPEGGGSQEITVNGNLVGGRWGFSLLYYEKIPTGFEPGGWLWGAYGQNNPGWIYWSFIEALAAHPWQLDIQWQYFANITEASSLLNFDIMKFARRYLAKKINNTPDVWYVSREKKLESQCWTGGAPPHNRYCYKPHDGDWEFFLYRKESAPNSATTYCHNPSQCGLREPAASHAYALPGVRKTNRVSGNVFMSFDIDDRYPPPQKTSKWEISLTFANQGTDKISLEYRNQNGQIVKKIINKGPDLGAIDSWVDYRWQLTDADFSGNKLEGVDFRINCEGDGDEFIHRIIVKPRGVGDQNGDKKTDEKDLTLLLKQWAPEQSPFLQILLEDWD